MFLVSKYKKKTQTLHKEQKPKKGKIKIALVVIKAKKLEEQKMSKLLRKMA